MNNKQHLAVAGVLVAITAVLVYFGLDNVLTLPVEASAEAVQIDSLFNLHVKLIAFLFALVVVLMLYAIVVFRRREGDDSDGQYFHTHLGLEVAWTIVPLLFVVYFGFLGTRILSDITQTSSDEMAVDVVGFQWGWRFEYPDSGIVSNELVLPKDQKIRLNLNSEDVLHSFWVPEFRVKQDLVPGRETHLRFTPINEGEYKVRCAELCGTNHSGMRAPVRVVSQSDYAAWVQEQTAPSTLSPADAGAQIAQNQGCTGCHSLDGSTLVGPSWQGLFGSEVTLADGTTVVADEAYIRDAIVNPNDQIVQGFPANVMPQDFGDKLSDEDINNLIEYIKTLQ